MSAKEIVVLKFGGSVLRDESDLTRAVQDIYREVRRGARVVAVVSAIGETTDALLEKAKAYGTRPDERALAALLHTGEAATAALLCLALDRAGIPSKVLTTQQAGIKTEGSPLDACPVAANVDRIREELDHAVVVLPGFAGVTTDGDISLLGRGGSDYTAIFLAHRLGASCKLVKDVDGLYAEDPNSTESAERYFQASYRTLLSKGGELIQPKAVHFAEEARQEFEIVGNGCEAGTTVGDLPNCFYPTPLNSPKRIKVAALLGCGTVGGGVYQRLAALPHLFEIVGVVNLDPDKAIRAGISEKHLERDAHRLIEKDCDIVIELIGGIEPAHSLIEHALNLGRHVITANKALLSANATELETLARNSGALLRYSASVGGALPALEIVRRVAGSEPDSVVGIVNGTCNFICDEVSSGVDFDVAVRRAQDEGYAEADPKLDLDGTDAAQKLVLLAGAAFGVELGLHNVDTTGIENLTPERVLAAQEAGVSLKLVAECKKTADGVFARVAPLEIQASHPFADTKGADNCLLVTTADGKTTMHRGRGAGRYPTTESVMADLFDIRNSFANSPAAKEAAV